MNKHKQIFSTPLIAGLAVALIIYMSFNLDHAASLALQPSAIMQQMQSNIYDKNGELIRSVRAEKMLHYNNGNKSIFANPSMSLKTASGQTWFITANKGVSLDQDNQIFLSGNVKFHRPQTKMQIATTITTDNATVYPHKKIMLSDTNVTFTRPDSIIKGTGIKADLNTGFILLKNKVHAIYDTQQKN